MQETDSESLDNKRGNQITSKMKYRTVRRSKILATNEARKPVGGAGRVTGNAGLYKSLDLE